jgi:large subunit ribosomal protein L20
MPRATNAAARKRRHKKVLKRASGFSGRQSKAFRIANNRVRRAMAFAYVGRKIKKRDYRALWNVRINVAARVNGMSYSRLIHGLHQAGIELDRKVLADIALHDPAGFARIAEMARS